MKNVITILTTTCLLFGVIQVHGSDLPNCGSGYRHNCFGTYTFTNGDKYVGEFRNDKFSGQGTLTFGSNSKWAGDKYVGGWRDDKQHGQGTYTHANGDKYVGEWRDGDFNGQGTYTFFATGNKYVGEWRDGKKHGQGTFTFGPNSEWAGDRYVGEFRDGDFNGQGTYTFADGSILQGIFANDDFLYAKKPDPPVVAKKSPKRDPDWSKLSDAEICTKATLYDLRNGTYRWFSNSNKFVMEAKKRGLLCKTNKGPMIADKSISPDSDKIISASSGSGFAITNSGHVITNNHVIEGCQNVKIHSKGQTIPATVLTFDPNNDIALLKGDFRPTTVFPLSGSKPELLQDIYVAGYPFGQQISTSVKVTKGIVSSLTGIGNNFSNIQIDAALQPGNSGGPILDDKGNVIGVAVAKLDLKKILEDYGTIPENTNFGVKTSVVRSITDSFNVSLPKPNRSNISKTELGQMIADGTYYLSCWMTMAQIDQMKSKKVIFQNLNLD